MEVWNDPSQERKLMKLHNLIKRCYLKIVKPFFKVEVLSENSRWNTIKSINITKKQNVVCLYTKNKKLICAEDHILIDSNHNEVLAKDSDGIDVITKDGVEKIIEVVALQDSEVLYDLSLDGLDNSDTKHLYFANGILSHNCVICDEFAFL